MATPSGDKMLHKFAMRNLPTVALLTVGIDLGFKAVAVQVLDETRNVEFQLRSLGDQVVSAQLVLTGEDQVVHLPELPMISGGKRGFMRQRGFPMKRQRKILHGEPYLRWIRAQHLANNRGRFSSPWIMFIFRWGCSDGVAVAG